MSPPYATYYHLQEADYPSAFPTSLDPVPVLIDKRTYLDAWIINYLYDRLLAVEQHVISNY